MAGLVSVHALGSEAFVLGRAGTGMWNIDQ
jgi:hypothetical protein